MAVINIVDIDLCIVLSHVNFPFNQYDRNLSFCTYAIMDNAPDVFVIENTLKSKFDQHPFVGEPYCLRFYAGAPIIWEGVKIGVFCILDSVPHEGFSTPNNLAILQDFAASVSDAMKDQRDTLQALERQKANLLVSGMYNLSLPLSNINALYSEMKQIASDLNELTSTTQSPFPEHNNNNNNAPTTPNSTAVNLQTMINNNESISSVKEEEEEEHERAKTIMKLTRCLSSTTGGIGGQLEELENEEKKENSVRSLQRHAHPFKRNTSSPELTWKQQLHRKKQAVLMKLALFQPALIVLSQQIECNIQLLLLLTSDDSCMSPSSSCSYEMESMTLEEVSYYLNIILKTQFPYLHFRWDDINEEKEEEQEKVIKIPWDAILKILHYSLLSTITTNPLLTPDASCIKTEIIGSIYSMSIQHPQQTLQLHIIHYYDHPAGATCKIMHTPEKREDHRPRIIIDRQNSSTSLSFKEGVLATSGVTGAVSVKQPASIVTTALTHSNTVTQLIHASYRTVSSSFSVHENTLHNANINTVTATDVLMPSPPTTQQQQCLVDYSTVLQCKQWIFEQLLCNLFHTNNIQGYYQVLSNAKGMKLLAEKEEQFLLFEGCTIEVPCEMIEYYTEEVLLSEALVATTGQVDNRESFGSQATDMSTHTIPNTILVSPHNNTNNNTTILEHNTSLHGHNKTRIRLEKSVLLHDNSFKSVHTRKHVVVNHYANHYDSHRNSPHYLPSIISNDSLPLSTSTPIRTPQQQQEQQEEQHDDNNTNMNSSKKARYSFESLRQFPSLLTRTFLLTNPQLTFLPINSNSNNNKSKSNLLQREIIHPEESNVLDQLVCSPMRLKSTRSLIPSSPLPPEPIDSSGAVELFQSQELIEVDRLLQQQEEEEEEEEEKQKKAAAVAAVRRRSSIITVITSRVKSDSQLLDGTEGISNGNSNGKSGLEHCATTSSNFQPYADIHSNGDDRDHHTQQQHQHLFPRLGDLQKIWHSFVDQLFIPHTNTNTTINNTNNTAATATAITS